MIDVIALTQATVCLGKQKTACQQGRVANQYVLFDQADTGRLLRPRLVDDVNEGTRGIVIRCIRTEGDDITGGK